MVDLSHVRESNSRAGTVLEPGLVAVFIGGTSGIGEYTLRQLAKYVKNGRFYIVGRSQESATRIIKETSEIGAEIRVEFIQADVSQLKAVDDVCRQLSKKETSINLLFMSQGSMGFNEVTSDGLPLPFMLSSYSRARFVFNLIPLLQAATSLRRVVSVLAGAAEGPISMDDFYGKSLPLMAWRGQISSMQSIYLLEASRRAPEVSFITTDPGIVETGIGRDAKHFMLRLSLAVSKTLLRFMMTSPDDSGERHMFMATSAMFRPRRNCGGIDGVPLATGLVGAASIQGDEGGGAYSLGVQCDPEVERTKKIMDGLISDGSAQMVLDKTMADFRMLTGSDIILGHD